MDLEFAAGNTDGDPRTFTMPLNEDGIIDWEPAIRTILKELVQGERVPLIANRFLATLGQTIVEVARREAKPLVVLSGGCFQNAPLLETTVARLREAGFTPLWSHEAPPNDGGLALGQAVIATAPLDATNP